MRENERGIQVDWQSSEKEVACSPRAVYSVVLLLTSDYAILRHT